MKKYIFGLLLHLFNFRISKFALIDNVSKIDKKAKIYRKSKIFNSTIGAYSYIASSTCIVYAKIGKYCSIASNVNVGLAKHKMDIISTSPIFYSKKNALGYTWTSQNSFEEYQEVIIGNDVWIGTKALIMSGVKIGDGAVIGANSVVTKDVAPYSIVGGIPAKEIKRRFNPEVIDLLLELKWWNYPKDTLRNKEILELFSKEIVDLSVLKELVIRLKNS